MFFLGSRHIIQLWRDKKGAESLVDLFTIMYLLFLYNAYVVSLIVPSVSWRENLKVKKKLKIIFLVSMEYL
jgi:hypothetical protein